MANNSLEFQIYGFTWFENRNKIILLLRGLWLAGYSKHLTSAAAQTYTYTGHGCYHNGGVLRQ